MSLSRNRISGVTDGLPECSAQTSRGEIEGNLQRDPRTPPEREGVSSVPFSVHREVECCLSSYSGSSPLLPGPARRLAEGASPGGPRLQSPSSPIPTSQGGAVLVANSSNPLEWTNHSPEANTGNNPIRCLPGRVGSSLQWSEDWGFMDSSGAEDAHQLSGTSCHRVGNGVIHQESQRCDSSIAAGQLDSCGLYQQPRENDIPNPRSLWLWALERDIILSVQHIPGVLNITAEHESRVERDRSDWMLSPVVFQKINQTLGPLEVDLFASQLAHQLPQFFSWRPDPQAEAIDAFQQEGYANPPWCLVGRVLSKVRKEETQLVLVAPVWRHQSWYPVLLGMLREFPRLLSPQEAQMQRGGQQRTEEFTPQLAAWPVSGKN